MRHEVYNQVLIVYAYKRTNKSTNTLSKENIMSENIEEFPTPAIENDNVSEKQKYKTFSVSIPQEQFDVLDKHRFLIFKDRPEFYRHVFAEYFNNIPAELLPQV